MTLLDLAPAATAFILIDLQNGIAGLPLAPHSFSTVLENSNKVAAALRDKGATIVYVRVAIDEILRLPVDAPVAIHKLLPLPLRPPSSSMRLTASQLTSSSVSGIGAHFTEPS